MGLRDDHVPAGLQIALVEGDYLSVIIYGEDDVVLVGELAEVQFCFGLLQRQGEEEGTTLANFRVEQTDATTVQLDKREANGEAKTGSACLAGGRIIHLREALEQFGLVFWSDTNTGVADRDQQFWFTLGAAICGSLDGDGTFFGEFDCIGDEVDDDLIDTNLICIDCGQVSRDFLDQLNGFIFDQARGGCERAVDHITNADLLHLQLHLTSLNF
ncbi:hypothetical protein SDC9_71389 [bioreactor metagenome]|uniref:Uncharacterized protein n=1 Tax=bioreactor metagenome TaxID=1076179 RepID=A0A644YAH3_9ZZZZ